MELLYSTETNYTYEEYKRFNKMLSFRRSVIIKCIIIEVFVLFMACLMNSLYFVVFSIIYPIILLLLPVFLNKQSKSIWESNKVAQNLNVKFDFYDTYFIATDENGETRIAYNKLHKIIETKTNFYLLFSKNQGVILNKSNFPEGLSDFLRDITIS